MEVLARRAPLSRVKNGEEDSSARFHQNIYLSVHLQDLSSRGIGSRVGFSARYRTGKKNEEMLSRFNILDCKIMCVMAGVRALLVTSPQADPHPLTFKHPNIQTSKHQHINTNLSTSRSQMLLQNEQGLMLDANPHASRLGRGSLRRLLQGQTPVR